MLSLVALSAPRVIAIENIEVIEEELTAPAIETVVEEELAAPAVEDVSEQATGNTLPVDEDPALATDGDAEAAEAETPELEGKVVTVDMPLAEVVIESEFAAIPDITRLTLDSFNLVDEPDVSAADVLTLGDLSGILDLRNMTLGAAVVGWQRDQLQALQLDRYDFLDEMTIAEVIDLARLHSKTVGEVPIVETAILTFLNHPVLMRERKVTLTRFLARYPEIGSIKLGLLDLPKYHYSAIPKLLNIPITAIPNWQTLTVDSIAGLEDLPIHRNLQIDGEIVTLTTARVGERTQIQLQQNSGFSATWPEALDDQAFQPFDSFFLKPQIAGETIRINAYFKSCVEGPTACKFVGPFAYPNYKVGDSFYLSQKDWRVVVDQEKQSIEFRREPAPVAVAQPAISPLQKKLVQAAAIGLLLVVSAGSSISIWLLTKKRKGAKS